MIPDLRKDLDRTNVDTYINGLITELDKLYIALSRDSALESQAQAKLTEQLVNYVRITQIYPENPPKDENPK